MSIEDLLFDETLVEPEISVSNKPNPVKADRNSLYLDLSENTGIPNPLIDIRQDNEKKRQLHIQQKALSDRLIAIEPIEKKVLNDLSLGPEAKARAISTIRSEAARGANVQDIALENILDEELEASQTISEELVVYAAGIGVAEQNSVKASLDTLKENVDAAFPVNIPYIEATSDALASGILFFNKGWDADNMLSEAFGFPAQSFFDLSADEAIEQADVLLRTMTPQQKIDVLKKLESFIVKEAGTFTDNRADAEKMLHTVDALFGDRVQVEAAKDEAIYSSVIDLALTMVGSTIVRGVAQGAGVAAAKAVSRKSVKEITESIPPVTPRTLFKKPEAVSITPVVKPSKLKVKLKVRQSIMKTGVGEHTPAAVIAKVAPRTSALTLKKAVEDTTGASASRLGAVREEIVDSFMVPKVPGSVLARGPRIIMDARKKSDDQLVDEVLDLVHDGKLYTPDELNAVVTKLETPVDIDVVHIAKSSISIDNVRGVVDIDYAIGARGGSEFFSYQDAVDAFENISSFSRDKLDVLKYDLADNSFKTVTKDSGDGAYLVRARYSHTLGGDSLRSKIFKGSANPLANSVDSQISYTKEIADSISRLDIRQSGISDMMSRLRKPLDGLSANVLNDVWSRVIEGAADSVEYTTAQLVKKFKGDNIKVAAYQAVRRIYRASYEMRNNKYRTHLIKRNFFAYDDAVGTVHWAKPIDELAEIAKIQTVWYKGKLISIDEIKDTNVTFMETFRPTSIKNPNGSVHSSKYLAADIVGFSSQPLPVKVLRESAGYIGRHLQTNHIVERIVVHTVNGQKIKAVEIAGVADNVKSAQKFINNQNDGAEYLVRRSRETSPDRASQNTVAEELEHMADLGMLGHTKARKDLSELDITHETALEAPEVTLARVQDEMVRTAVMDQWVEYNTSKWIKTFAHLFVDDRGVPIVGMPRSGKLILNPKVLATTENIDLSKQAALYRNRIKLTSGTHEGQIGQRIQDQLLSASDFLSKMSVDVTKKSGSKAVAALKVAPIDLGAAAFRGLGARDLVGSTKHLGFIRFIVGNPVRQFLLQSGAGTLYGGVKHGSKYYASGAVSRDMAFLLSYHATKDISKHAADSAASVWALAAGKSKKEALDFYDSWRSSGIEQSATSHEFLENGFGPTSTLRSHAGTSSSFFRPVGVAYKKTVNAFSRAGFQKGEGINRTAAWLAIRNRNIQEGTLKSVSNQDIAVEALQLTGNMGRHNKLAWQNGTLGIPFQFMSHPTRMVSLMLPSTKWTSWVANSNITNATKARLGLWSALVYGTGGLGLTAAYRALQAESGIEPDPEVENIIEEGLAMYAAEQILEGFTVTDASLDLSKSFGPLAGLFNDIKVVIRQDARAATPLGKMLDVGLDIMLDSPTDWEEAAGPAANMAAFPAKAMRNMYKILISPSFGAEEKLELQARELMRILPLLDNAAKAKMMYQMGAYIDKYGNEVAKTTVAEAFAKGFVGANPSDVTEYYQQRADYFGSTGGKPDSHKHLSDIGTSIAEFIYLSSIELDGNNITKEILQTRMEASYAYIEMAYPELNQAHHIRQSSNKRMNQLFGGEANKKDKWIEALTEEGELSSEVGMYRILENLRSLKPTPSSEYAIQQILKSIETLESNKGIQ